MKRTLIILLAALAAGFYLGTPAYATETTPGPSFASCPNLDGWYANPDEQADLPAATEDGLKFEGKDLIHHATSGIDLADMDKVTGSFVATEPGKVVFKVETSAPYSTIVTNIDGKLWSTAMTYDQQGGQGHPVNKYSELVGLDTRPGKAKYTDASAVVTFGVGYWVEEGSTVVSSISFHGKTYPLTCKPATTPPTTKPTVSASATTKPTTSAPVTTRPTSSSPAAGGIATGQAGPSLPVTGAPVALMVGGGAVLLLAGAGLLIATRRRKVGFTA